MSYILVLIGAVLCMAASSYVNSTYKKFSRYAARSGMTGAQVAQKILDDNGITDVVVRHVSGDLTDHYNPSKKTVNLSDSVFGSSSVAAISVAAHECGHVLQHYKGYLPIKIRTALVPFANIGSKLGLPMVLFGIILGGGISLSNASYGASAGVSIGSIICTIGIWVFSLAVAFQIATLPVEFNASMRAMKILENSGILQGEEVGQGSSVLRAAALTYVAAAASSILQLLRIIMIANGGKRRR